jgi:hypothetical protein
MGKVKRHDKSCGNVFKDLGFSDAESRIYQFRSYFDDCA